MHRHVCTVLTIFSPFFTLTFEVARHKRSWTEWFNTVVGRDYKHEIFLNDEDSKNLIELFQNIGVKNED